jgi:hypothetical protein
MGIELPAVVPAGPDNPMGHHAIRLAAYGGVYLLHGTNADFGIGMRVSSGCIRLRDDDIKALYNDHPGHEGEYYQHADQGVRGADGAVWWRSISRCQNISMTTRRRCPLPLTQHAGV